MNRIFDITASQIKFVAVLSGATMIAAVTLFVRSYSDTWTGDPVKSEAAAPPYAGMFTVDLNLSPIDSLELVPGIGPVLAGRIVGSRAAQRFDSVGDALRIRGIGPATLEMIRPYLKVDN